MLPPGVRAIYATLHVENEVNNGGFDQYFCNSEGRLAELAIEGFAYLETPRYAELMKRAVAAWRLEETLTEVELEDWSLGVFDDEFYELGKMSDLSRIRVSFVRSHTDEFFMPPA